MKYSSSFFFFLSFLPFVCLFVCFLFFFTPLSFFVFLSLFVFHFPSSLYFSSYPHTFCFPFPPDSFTEFAPLLTTIKHTLDTYIHTHHEERSRTVRHLDRLKAHTGLHGTLQNYGQVVDDGRAAIAELERKVCRIKAERGWCVVRLFVRCVGRVLQQQKLRSEQQSRLARKRALLRRLGAENAVDEEALTAELSTQRSRLENIQADDELYVSKMQRIILEHTLQKQQRRIEALHAETKAAHALVYRLRLAVHTLTARSRRSTTEEAERHGGNASASAVNDNNNNNNNNNINNNNNHNTTHDPHDLLHDDAGDHSSELDITETLHERAARVVECSALFERAFAAGEYKDAAHIAVNSAERLLRTLATWERFRKVSGNASNNNGNSNNNNGKSAVDDSSDKRSGAGNNNNNNNNNNNTSNIINTNSSSRINVHSTIGGGGTVGGMSGPGGSSPHHSAFARMRRRSRGSEQLQHVMMLGDSVAAANNGVLSPALVYATAILQTSPSAAECLMCVQCAVLEARLDVVAIWLAQVRRGMG